MSVEELEEYFEGMEFVNPIQLNEETRIVNVRSFIDSHIRYIKRNPRSRAVAPYHKRLIKLYEFTKCANV